MTNSISVISRKVATSFFTLVLLISAAFGQDLRSKVQEQELPMDGAKTESAELVPVLTITPITWGVVGLDSNNLTVGPNHFPVGARVCNTGGDPAVNVASTFVWDTANALINLRTGSSSSLALASLAAGSCTDFYYEIEITRNAAAYNTTRGFHITATADTLGVISTPTPREIFVEKLVSQNRNSVNSIKLNGATIPFGGTMNMVVGNTYTIELNASTATNGYEQIESFINLPNVIFQTLGVTSTYTAPTGYTGTKLYEDACGWDPVPTSPDYRSCIGPANVPSGNKAGGTVSITYTVKVLSGAGTASTLNTLIYDFSGSSYHYNSDFSSTFVIASITNPPSAAGAYVSGRVSLAAGNGIRNVQVALIEADGTVHLTKTGSFGYYRFEDIPAGQTVLVSLTSKSYTFSPSTRIVSLNEDLADFDWVSNE
ncbi:MAG: carboxypeptidase regulatory-like domain-containing protein [Pyrinomonadaceae bacterium]|nr:carboxypeptidase regulatory-like domain-containing protein [Acidobacteriota bacterium]MBP7377487.1 carboxypeptidase regulatory-like domain-containing protein [Pyrinomonadaceae bacterium]